jgi:hypothetical protein
MAVTDLTAPVRKALESVHASAGGTAHFESWDDARSFEEAVHVRYPHEGYGTSTELSSNIAGGFAVAWRVFSAD